MDHRIDNGIRRLALRSTLAIALAMPAAALAAAPANDPGSERRATDAGPPRDTDAAPSRPLLSGGALADERERPQGPVHPVSGRVSYGDAQAAFGHARGRPHEGQDVFAPAGTPVVSPADGLVVDAGSGGGRGNWLAVYDPKREQTYSFFHLLDRPKPGVGSRVKAGEKLGAVGCTGSCWGDHLHFELREGRGSYGGATDPMPFLERAERVGA